jgi:hypothetical protein
MRGKADTGRAGEIPESKGRGRRQVGTKRREKEMKRLYY